MAKVKEIYVEASFTKNLGNYQNFKPTAGATIIIEEGDNLKEVFKDGWEMVGDQIAEQLKLFEEDTKGMKRGL